MAGEKERIPLHHGIDVTGDQTIILGSIVRVLSEAEVDNLINGLTGGKELVKEKKAALKVIASVDRQFNGVGKPIKDKKLTGNPDVMAPVSGESKDG